MDPGFTGKRVLVTGASKGIGLAVVRAFQAEGAEVVATARRSTPELVSTGAAFFPVDLATAEGPRRMVEEVLAADPRLDVLVNNAGGGAMTDEAFDDVLDGDEELWARIFDLNLYAAVRATRSAIPALTEARGAVINISSEAARRPGGGPVHYSAAKAALNAFSRTLAEKLGPQGVRVNTVTPSGTRTQPRSVRTASGRRSRRAWGSIMQTCRRFWPSRTAC